MPTVIGKLRRGLHKPPSYIIERACSEARLQAEKYLGPWRARRLDESQLLRLLEAESLGGLWERLAARAHVTHTAPLALADYNALCEGDGKRILLAAELALRHEVELLGSGPVPLGATIDWHKDYKTNLSWPREYHRAIEYANLERPSDVKFPWELSRLQWLIPAGQAYLLTNDERFARGVRAILEQWMVANPCGYGVNWACAMEPALRILTWSWLFWTLAGSKAWSDPAFRFKFLQTLFLHADFVAHHLEKSDINGNHYTADAAGLAHAGLFFDAGPNAAEWSRTGWQILTHELPKQVFEDGVDFEASIAYHRLVFELFLLPALYRQVLGKAVPEPYWQRLREMARFTVAYTRTDGSTPLWGDADDARALPFGPQEITDHRYLIGIAAQSLDSEFKRYFSGPRGEVFWLLGPAAASALGQTAKPREEPASAAFPQGGFYIMRRRHDHVFIDCGPVGLGGRGGHGHNDLLSFEAALCGARLIVDPGSYVYTADYKLRNRFRSTAFHNTIQVNGEEINRFPGPLDLWSLHDDAAPIVNSWSASEDISAISMAHTGFLRLEKPAHLSRDISLDHTRSRLTISDGIEAAEPCDVSIPLHFDPDTAITQTASGFSLRSGGTTFFLQWTGLNSWTAEIVDCLISPSYGVLRPSHRLVFVSKGAKCHRLAVVIAPCPNG